MSAATNSSSPTRARPPARREHAGREPQRRPPAAGAAARSAGSATRTSMPMFIVVPMDSTSRAASGVLASGEVLVERREDQEGGDRHHVADDRARGWPRRTSGRPAAARTAPPRSRRAGSAARTRQHEAVVAPSMAAMGAGGVRVDRVQQRRRSGRATSGDGHRDRQQDHDRPGEQRRGDLLDVRLLALVGSARPAARASTGTIALARAPPMASSTIRFGTWLAVTYAVPRQPAPTRLREHDGAERGRAAGRWR